MTLLDLRSLHCPFNGSLANGHPSARFLQRINHLHAEGSHWQASSRVLDSLLPYLRGVKTLTYEFY